VDHLVKKALAHGSRDNVTGVAIDFEQISDAHDETQNTRNAADETYIERA
jgi:serine/threonine protein phosphatase PrpC